MLLNRKLGNVFRKIEGVEEVKLKNTIVNGAKRGCYGFVKYKGRWFYVNSEVNFVSGTQLLFRSCKDDKDYSGNRNRYVKYNMRDMNDLKIKLESELNKNE